MMDTIYGSILITPRDIEILARTIYGEARGESWLGKVGVAWSVRNRVYTDLHGDGKPDWWGEGYGPVCLKRAQYSCWLESDPNRDKLMRVTTADPFFRECLAAAAAVMSGTEADPTEGSTHYKVATLPWPKDWGAERQPIRIIGHHAFYKLEG